MMTEYRAKLLEDPKYKIEAVKGDFIMAVTERICEVMELEGVARQELACKMEKTKGHVSQLLNGERNMTLGTLAEIAYRLGYKPKFTMEKQATKRTRTVLSRRNIDLEGYDHGGDWNLPDDCIPTHAEVEARESKAA
jgi:transcriptional regulator with XRE-family HTH domain